MSMVLRLGIVVVVVIVAIGGGIALTSHPAIDAVAPQPRTAFDATLIEQGAALAALGNCASCHTTADGMPYAGGVPLKTQFGTIYGSNLTPDADKGIGQWSEQAFVRAMREGVSRDGHLLYPAFPYTHFTHVTDADLHALYAFVMSRDPAHVDPPANRMVFPLQFRPLIAGWNALYFSKSTDRDAIRDNAAADRGAYLVEGLGHCGACHTGRNALGGEKGDERLAGNIIEGWYAPPINHRSPSPIPWGPEALTTYLRTGIAEDHAIAGGPMQEAVSGLSRANEADVAIIASYIVSTMEPITPERNARAAASRQRAVGPLVVAAPSASQSDPHIALGASIYATACASCHDRGRDISSNSGLRMPLAVALYDDEPHSFLRVVREGVYPETGDRGRFMPAFGSTLNDEQLGALAAYLRKTAADAPPWPKLDAAVKETAQ